jgi:hypothetical protein
MGVENLVEEAGGADKTVEVFEAFEVRSYLEQQLVGEPSERGPILKISCLIRSWSGSCGGCMPVFI